jgi:hypothetical protein
LEETDGGYGNVNRSLTMIEPVLMETGSHIGPITATAIVAIGSNRR